MICGSRHCEFITYVNTQDSCSFNKKLYRRINNYLLTQKIGTGSYSKVFLGVDGDKKFAIKRISLTDLSRKSNGIMQLEREIRLMNTFNHPNILKINEVLHSVSDNHVYLVLEYADCGSIGGYLDKGYHFQMNSIRSIIKQVSQALSYVHSLGFVHQDIKPANILMKSNGNILLADFGIGHSFMSASTVVGTPAYQAPEAINNELDDIEYSKEEESLDESSKEDEECPQLKEEIWALGVTLYQLIFNDLPYMGGNLYEIISQIKSKSLTLPYEIDPKVEKLLRKMLEVDPDKRISLDEVMNDPFVRDAPDFVTEKVENTVSSDSEDDLSTLSYNSLISDKKYDIIQIDALKCDPGYSFAQAALTIQSKLEQINAPYALNDTVQKSNARSTNNLMLYNTNENASFSPKLTRTPSIKSKSPKFIPRSAPINFSPH